ncbi:limonene hydroxylase [Thermoactinomyces mirandus]|uniref:limonene hydroxylase n=1 Tax=Thermoactinomyces mirandus TaxID=2756294 RepID=UPI001C688F02|nr:limonene hydroxylase [Thermoactinomyces mirandus]
MGQPSVYHYIKEQIDQYGKIVKDTLPDEDSSNEEILFAPGAIDGMLEHHGMRTEEDDARIKKLVKCIRQQVTNPGNKTRRATYLAVMDDKILGYIDVLLKEIRIQSDLNPDWLYQEAIWFIQNSAHREVVKLGIALLGLFQCEDDLDLLFTIGRHDEFTLYVSVAIQNGTADPDLHLFQLVQLVDGWGKIHIVERLQPETQEIRDWLLRKGCRNSIMDEYLAYTCAEKGKLHMALKAEKIDTDLYHGAGIIISALINGGWAAEDIDDYLHAYSVLSDYLRHSRIQCKTATDLNVIVEIKRFLEQEEEQWRERYEQGWTPEQREELVSEVRSFLADEKWEIVILRELQSEQCNLHAAVQVAEELSLDIWFDLLGRLKKDLLNEDIYHVLIRTTDLDRIRHLVRLVEETLPLDQITTGPALEGGTFGEKVHKYKLHCCIETIVQGLNRFAGTGIPLIRASLQSPVIRNRTVALNTLKAWEVSEWVQECSHLVANLAQSDPDEDVRLSARKLLKRVSQ